MINAIKDFVFNVVLGILLMLLGVAVIILGKTSMEKIGLWDSGKENQNGKEENKTE